MTVGLTPAAGPGTLPANAGPTVASTRPWTTVPGGSQPETTVPALSQPETTAPALSQLEATVPEGSASWSSTTTCCSGKG
jgi:hypothetical protein